MPESSIKHVVLISGPIGSGKTTLSRLLELRFGFCVVSTRELLTPLSGGRRALQAAGVSLDESTAGRWVRDGLLGLRSRSPTGAFFVVDSVRTLDQLKWVRKALGGMCEARTSDSQSGGVVRQVRFQARGAPISRCCRRPGGTESYPLGVAGRLGC